MRRVLVDQNTVDVVIAAHNAGHSTLAIARDTSLSPKVVRRVLREHDCAEGKLTRVRRDMFVPPFTAADAYWLGFLNADGYVNPERGFTRLKLGWIDVDHVRAFAAYAGLPADAVRREVNKSTGKAQAYVDITGRAVVDRMVDLGLTGRKANRHVVDVDAVLVRHYLRGLVDADGCISRQRLSICCTPVHAQWISTQLTRVFQLPPRTAYEHMGIKRVYVPKTLTPKVLAWLYTDIPSNTALPRKLAAAGALIRGDDVGEDSAEETKISG